MTEDKLELLKAEIKAKSDGGIRATYAYMFEGYKDHLNDEVPITKAYAISSLFKLQRKVVYDNDLVAGSLTGVLTKDISQENINYAAGICASYGVRSFVTNTDHFAPDYETLLAEGLDGMLARIARSRLVHKQDPDSAKKLAFLDSAEIVLRAFSDFIEDHAKAAEIEREKHKLIAETCHAIAHRAPKSFHEALSLVWLVHVALCSMGKYAIALGRLDRYLRPFYENDINNGVIDEYTAYNYVACTLYKIGEARQYGGDDVVNIAIGGVAPDGSSNINGLTYIILHAVRDCRIPGPNLSARLFSGAEDKFLDECLKVIGTGIGYPALMNDDVNIPALYRHGYSLEDSRNYCMVGCIENFIQGKQPAWSDGRYNSPKYIELALNNGRCVHTGLQLGPLTGDASELDTMDKFMTALKTQMEYGAALYARIFNNENNRYNRYNYVDPFMSLFCDCCIDRALDINDGGAKYPSVHGAGCMGIATVADSLAAIELYVYNNKELTLTELRDILRTNFEGREDIRAKLLAAPKYGNDDEFADKYAVWFVDVHDEIFSKYRTWDGGAFYTAIASNVSNIPAGLEIGATPDGRRDGESVSDAASPMHGMDKNGPTAVVKSLTRPCYAKVSCGTVLNQKYSPSMFKDPDKRQKLLELIKVYFKLGGQEMQINSVSRAVLTEAMEHPEEYESLVVRVSGFSAYYNTLSREVKEDILKRTEHE